VLISHAMFMYTYIGVSVFSTYLRFKHYKGSIIAQHKGCSLYIYIYLYCLHDLEIYIHMLQSKRTTMKRK